MRLVPGQLMHHRYRLDKRLAQGGMGEVWKGYDIELNRPVAIKALRSDLDDPNSSRLRRLRAEAHNSADLAHPNIAALFDYYENDGVGFLVMEYVDSPSLAQIYKERAPMPAVELLPILIQVARGLYVAHSHGVIHRDVKPANIMVSADGQVKITDFGVSYSTNQAQITQDGMVVGTAQYISPEQAQGEQATPQSDIYSLGVVAYEGLCGHRPFTGKTSVDIAAAHVNEPVPPLPEDIDWRLREYVMGMLAKDPKDRPRDALEVSRNLQAILDHLWDEQTANIPPIHVHRDKPHGRTIYSDPYEPPAWMVDLTDRAAVKRDDIARQENATHATATDFAPLSQQTTGRIVDMHFDANSAAMPAASSPVVDNPVTDAAAAAAAQSTASAFASTSAARSGAASSAMPTYYAPKDTSVGISINSVNIGTSLSKAIDAALAHRTAATDQPPMKPPSEPVPKPKPTQQDSQPQPAPQKPPAEYPREDQQAQQRNVEEPQTQQPQTLNRADEQQPKDGAQ